MAFNVQIVGGGRDGDLVPFSGPYLRLPVRRTPHYVTADASMLPSACAYRIEDYDLRRGWDGEMYYVRRP